MGARPHKCPKCESDFKRPGHFKIHMLLHRGKRPFACPESSESFRQSYQWKYHRLIHMDEIVVKQNTDKHMDTRPHKCPKCELDFKRKGDLNRHMHLHEKSFTCRECPESFKQSNQLKFHSFIHMGKNVKTPNTKSY